MYQFLTIFIILICLLLILVVLIQKPKGSGLAAGFSGLNSMMGVHRTTNEVERWTWYLSIALLAMAISINFFIERGSSSDAPTGSQLQERVENLPTAPTPTPVPSQQQSGGNQGIPQE